MQSCATTESSGLPSQVRRSNRCAASGAAVAVTSGPSEKTVRSSTMTARPGASSRLAPRWRFRRSLALGRAMSGRWAMAVSRFTTTDRTGTRCRWDRRCSSSEFGAHRQSDLWAVGYDYTSRTGVILHSSGQTWIRYFATSGPRLYSVFGSPQGDVFAVGELGMLLRLAKGRWETLPPLTTNRLLSGALFSTQLGLAVGKAVRRWLLMDSRWKLASDGDITNLFAVSASEASDLWLVGDAGRVSCAWRPF